MRCIAKLTMLIFFVIFSSSFTLLTSNATRVPASHRVYFIIIAVMPVELCLLTTENYSGEANNTPNDYIPLGSTQVQFLAEPTNCKVQSTIIPNNGCMWVKSFFYHFPTFSHASHCDKWLQDKNGLPMCTYKTRSSTQWKQMKPHLKQSGSSLKSLRGNISAWLVKHLEARITENSVYSV